MLVGKIRGFTLLELLVVVVIIGIVSAVAFPNFSSWKREREVRVAVEKTINIFTIANTQAQGGYYPFTQVEIREQAGGNKIWVRAKGMTQDAIADIQNAGKRVPECKISSSYWTENLIDEKVFTNISLDYQNNVGAVCFSKDGSFYQTVGQLNGSEALVICHKKTNGDLCGSGSTIKQPAYMIEWSRFGSINKYKWSGSAWTKQ